MKVRSEIYVSLCFFLLLCGVKERYMCFNMFVCFLVVVWKWDTCVLICLCVFLLCFNMFSWCIVKVRYVCFMWFVVVVWKRDACVCVFSRWGVKMRYMCVSMFVCFLSSSVKWDTCVFVFFSVVGVGCKYEISMCY